VKTNDKTGSGPALLRWSLPALTLLCGALAAAEPSAAAQPRETVWSLTLKGGWLMIPIGLCSVIVMTWTIERLISLRKSRITSTDLLRKIYTALPPRGSATRDDIAAALRICAASGSIASRVLRAGIEKLHRDEGHAQTYLEEAASKEIHILKRKLRPFDICVSVAPLLGLLGTIFGMISCFERTTLVDTSSRAETLANGIYMALVTTAAGLCVAIPALVIYHYFLGRVDRIQDIIEEIATDFLDHYFGTPAVRSRSGHSSSSPEGSLRHSPAALHAEASTGHTPASPGSAPSPPGGEP
jgi:biopolymer transport protein ExbB